MSGRPRVAAAVALVLTLGLFSSAFTGAGSEPAGRLTFNPGARLDPGQVEAVRS